jgi:hypothetical protein
MTFNVLEFLPCDLIRREDTGKHLIVGVYGNGVNLTVDVLPHLTALAYWVRLTHDVRGTASFKLEILSPEQDVAYFAEGQYSEDPAVGPGGPDIFAFPQTFPTAFLHPGVHTARMTFAGETKDIGSFLVRFQRVKTADQEAPQEAT